MLSLCHVWWDEIAEHCDTGITFGFKPFLNNKFFLAWKWPRFNFLVSERSRLISTTCDSSLGRTFAVLHTTGCSLDIDIWIPSCQEPQYTSIPSLSQPASKNACLNVRRRFAGAVLAFDSVIDVQGSTYFINNAGTYGGKLFQEEYVRTEVIVGDRATSISIRSYVFILVIHHLRPTINDAGPN